MVLALASAQGAVVEYFNFENSTYTGSAPTDGLWFTDTARGDSTGQHGTLGISGTLARGYNQTYGPQFDSDTLSGINSGGFAMDTFDNSGDAYISEGALHNWSSPDWTLELHVYMDVMDAYETMVGRDGSSFSSAESDFYFQRMGDGSGRYRIRYYTADGIQQTLPSDTVLAAGQWYGLAVVADSTAGTLTLYVDDGSGYVQDGQLSGLSGNLGIFSSGLTWTFGRGWYNGGQTDFMDAHLDNIRFSDTALSASELISLNTPASDVPFLFRNRSPSGLGVLNDVILSVDVEDGAAQFASAELYLDTIGGSNIFASATGSDGTTTVTSTPQTLDLNSEHTAYIVVSGAPEGPVTNEWTFTMAPGIHPINVSPADSGIANPVVLRAEIEDWASTLDAASIYLDGNLIGIDGSNKVAGVTTLSSVATNLYPDTTHTGRVVVAGSPESYNTNEWTFTMAPAFYSVTDAPDGTGLTSPVVLTSEITEGSSMLASAELYVDGASVAIGTSNKVSGVATINSEELNLDPGYHTGMIIVAGSPFGLVTNEWTFAIAEQNVLVSNDLYTADALPNVALTLDGYSELNIGNPDALELEGTVNLQSIDSWIFLPSVKPVDAIERLGRVKVNGAPAINNSSVRVAVHGQGSVIIPYPSDFQPLEVFEGENFTGESVLLSPNTPYGTILSGNISSFILKRGYEVTLASGANGTGGINFVAADGDLKISVLPDGLNNHVNFIRIFAWNWVAKKGTSDTMPWDLNATWFYNWNAWWWPDDPNWEYAGIKQQRWWPGTPNASDAGGMGMTHFSGYNEPNNPVEDAYESLNNGDVATAVSAWPDLESSGLRIGAPAVTDGGRTWILDFMNQADAAGRRVDYVPIHYYRSYWNNDDPAGAASQLYNFLKDIYDQTHKPIWLTEFNNGANWTDNAHDPTVAQNRDVIEAMINMMDDAPWIERYSIYSRVEWFRQTHYDGGGLTPMGQMYKNHEAPLSYQQIIPGESMHPSASYDFEHSLDDRSGSGNHGVSKDYPDYVAGHGGGTAIQFDGVDDHVILPDSLSDSTDFTFAAWVNWAGGGNWQRIFDFGIMDSDEYMFLTPSEGSVMRFTITTSGWNNEQRLETSTLPVDTWTHVAVTLSGNTGRLYVNGSQVDVNTSMTVNPSQLGAIQHYLGRSQFPSDPHFGGKIDDVIITDTALSAGQVAALMNNDPPQASVDLVTRGGMSANVPYTNSVADIASDPDGGAITYTKVYGPSWLSIASDGTLSGTPPNINDQSFTVRATDAAGASTYFILTTTELGDYASFVAGHGIPGEPFEGDWNTNGIPNGMEYYLGFDPADPLPPQPVLTWTNDYLSVVHPFNPSALGVTGMVEWTTDLLSSNWYTSGVINTTNSFPDQIETTLGNSTTNQLFIRLKVND